MVDIDTVTIVGLNISFAVACTSSAQISDVVYMLCIVRYDKSFEVLTFLRSVSTVRQGERLHTNCTLLNYSSLLSVQPTVITTVQRAFKKFVA